VGVFSGPDLSESGLVLSFDAGNRKCFANSVINSLSWNLGSGGATYYSQNGNTNENERVLGTDPFGKSSIVWETRPSGDGNADGGWNSDYFGIDNTKLYRFSVWVKRTSTTSGGTFYLGLYGNASGIRRTDNNTVEGNPYWDCRGTGGFEKDVWYLVVGHCYPYNTSYTGQHPESGIYTVSGGTTKVASINACNIGADVKWAGSDVTSAVHRCYHYYCGDSTTRLQLFDPRIDAIDGTEPSIATLLSGFTASRLANYNNDSIIGTFANTPTYSSSNGGSIVFDGTDDYVRIPYNNNLNPTTITVSAWIKRNQAVNYAHFIGLPINNSTWNAPYMSYGVEYIGTTDTISFPLGFTDNTFAYTNASAYGNNRWFYFAATYDQSNVKVYIDGALITTRAETKTLYNSTADFYIGAINTSSQYPLNGNIAQVQIYNKALSAAEIQQNFNANRGRFGI
jgi:hypothetical protein